MMTHNKHKRLTSHFLSESHSRYTHSPPHNFYINRACHVSNAIPRNRKNAQSSLNNYYANVSESRHCCCCPHHLQQTSGQKQGYRNNEEYYISQPQFDGQAPCEAQLPTIKSLVYSQSPQKQSLSELAELKQSNKILKAENESLRVKTQSQTRRAGDEIADLKHENDSLNEQLGDCQRQNERLKRQLVEYQVQIESSRENNQRIQSLERQIQKQLCSVIHANKLLQEEKQEKDSKLAEQSQRIRYLETQLQASKDRYAEIEKMQDSLCSRINNNVRMEKNIFSKIEPIEQQVAHIGSIMENVSLKIKTWEQEIEQYNSRLSQVEGMTGSGIGATTRQSDTITSQYNNFAVADESYDNNSNINLHYGDGQITRTFRTPDIAYSQAVNPQSFYDNRSWLSRIQF